MKSTPIISSGHKHGVDIIMVEEFPLPRQYIKTPNSYWVDNGLASDLVMATGDIVYMRKGYNEDGKVKEVRNNIHG